MACAGATVFLYVLAAVDRQRGGRPAAVLLQRIRRSSTASACRTRRFPAGFGDQAKSFALGLLLGGAAANLIYSLIRRSPDRWWLPAGALFTLLVVGLTNLAPVLLLPLFYTRQAARARGAARRG